MSRHFTIVQRTGLNPPLQLVLIRFDGSGCPHITGYEQTDDGEWDLAWSTSGLASKPRIGASWGLGRDHTFLDEHNINVTKESYTPTIALYRVRLTFDGADRDQFDDWLDQQHRWCTDTEELVDGRIVATVEFSKGIGALENLLVKESWVQSIEPLGETEREIAVKLPDGSTYDASAAAGDDD